MDYFSLMDTALLTLIRFSGYSVLMCSCSLSIELYFVDCDVLFCNLIWAALYK